MTDSHDLRSGQQKKIDANEVEDLLECYRALSSLYLKLGAFHNRIAGLETSVQFLLKKNAEIGTYTFEGDAETIDDLGGVEES